MKKGRVKRLIAVMLCTVMLTGCGAKGTKSKDAGSNTVVEAAKTNLGLEELSKDEIMNFYQGDGNEVEFFRDKVGVQDEEVLNLRKEKGSFQEQNPAKEIIMLGNNTNEGSYTLTIVKLDKDVCQDTFSKYSMNEVFYQDDSILLYNAKKTHCNLVQKIDDEHLMTGMITWSYVGETTEHSEYTKKIDAFYNAIGAQNPIGIIEKNADKLD